MTQVKPLNLTHTLTAANFVDRFMAQVTKPQSMMLQNANMEFVDGVYTIVLTPQQDAEDFIVTDDELELELTRAFRKAPVTVTVADSIVDGVAGVMTTILAENGTERREFFPSSASLALSWRHVCAHATIKMAFGADRDPDCEV